jgi:Endonuclease-reverse transcriptase
MVITDLETNINFHKVEIFDNSDCDNFHISDSNNLKILHFNARSIKSGDKLAEIDSFLNDLKCRIHVIVISETWVREKEKNLYNIPNYISNYSWRPQKTAGGVGIFVHKDLNFKILKNYISDIINYMTIEILFANSILKITGFYRPPSLSFDEIDNFKKIFEETLVTNGSTNSLLFGDFNINLLNTNNNLVKEYLELLRSYGFFICDPNTITRPSSGSVIDHVISNNFLLKANMSHFPNDISDHKMTIFEQLDFKIPSVNDQTTSNYQKLNLENLKQYISENHFNQNFDNEINIDILYDSFINYFNQCCNENCTTVTIRKRKKLSVREWIDESKRYWYKKMIDNIGNDLIKTEYKLILNQITAAKRIKKLDSMNLNLVMVMQGRKKLGDV